MRTSKPSVRWVLAACLSLSSRAAVAGDAHPRAPATAKSAPGAKSHHSAASAAATQQVLSVQFVDTVASAPVADPTPDGCIPSWVIDASGIRRLPDRCPSAASASAIAPANTALLTGAAGTLTGEGGAGSDACAPGWVIDSKGIQRIRSGCGPDAVAEPSPPPAATAAVTHSPGCDPPWYIDAQGRRRLRPKCL